MPNATKQMQHDLAEMEYRLRLAALVTGAFGSPKCQDCVDYLRRRREVLIDEVVKKANEEGVEADYVMSRFTKNLHDKHQKEAANV